MTFPKLVLPLSVAGAVAGLGLSYLIPPRYTATARLELKEVSPEAGVPEVHRALVEFFSTQTAELLSDAGISEIIQDSRIDIYKSDRDRISLESAIAKTRKAIGISVADSPWPGASAFRLSFTGSDERTAQAVVNAMITRLIQGQRDHVRDALEAERIARDKGLQTEVGELRTRLAALESRLGVAPPERPTTHPAAAVNRDISPVWSAMMNAGPRAGLMREQVVLEPLEAPTAKKDFPDPLIFAAAFGLAGLLGAILCEFIR